MDANGQNRSAECGSWVRPHLGQHDVARLEVPMREPLAVRLVERIGDFDGVSSELDLKAADLSRGDPQPFGLPDTP